MQQTKIIRKMKFNQNESSEIFDRETINCLLKSEEDIENGRTRKAAEVMKEIKEKYGF